jgi:cytochrome c oxidase subunit 3
MSADIFTDDELRHRAIRTRRMLTWFIIFAIVMFFAGLTSAFVVSMSGGYWVNIDLPPAFYISTGAIVISSLFAQWALMSAQNGRRGMIAPLLVITLVLGIVFTWSQFRGWSQLVERGQYVVGKVLDVKGSYGTDYTIMKGEETLILENGNYYLPSDERRMKPLNPDLEEYKNTASSYIYALTAAHLMHVAFGLLSLIVMIVMAFLGRYGQQWHVGLWSGVVYWHFLGGLWIYLLLFLTFVH